MSKFREEVNYAVFLNWISDRFSEYRESGEEIKINSVFIEDQGFHLYCNPQKNVYHCWKSNEAGSLINLVRKIDNCDWQTAKITLGIGNRIRNLDAEVEKFMSEAYPALPSPPPSDTIKLPESTYRLSELSEVSPSRLTAETYLKRRGMPLNGFYYCSKGRYRERIIIPYYGRTGELRYWNGRDVTGKHRLRYWSPSKKDCGVGKEDFVYFYRWPSKGELVILTEGEFDAASLTLSGLWGAALSGKEIGEKQIEILRDYRICLSFDNDKWWKSSLGKMGSRMLKEGMNLTYVSPPVGFKDWNEVFVACGGEDLKKYILGNQSDYNQWSSLGI